MGAELPALIVLLVISIIFNIGFIGFFLHKKKSWNNSEYKKVVNDDVEIPMKIKEKPAEAPPAPEPCGNLLKNEETLAVPKLDPVMEEPKQEKEKQSPPKHALRSVENDQRSEQDAKGLPRQREPQQRSDRQRLHEPVGRNEFIECMRLVVQFINEYFDESHKQPVIPDNEVSTSRLKSIAPEKGEDCSAIIKDIKEIVVPNICHTQHPRYHAKHCGKSLADIVGSTISSALGYDVNSSPIIDAIEGILCKWLSSALGLPQIKRELGASVALNDPIGTVCYTLRDVYVTVIRHAIKRFEKSNDALKSDDSKKKRRADFVVYCSDDSQVSLEEACSIAKVKLRKILTFESDQCGMTAKKLTKQMEKDVGRRLIPLVIVANYGSANVAATDEVWDLVKISRGKDIWLHLDSTYAGCKWIDTNNRNNVHALITEAHSVHVAFSSLFPYAGRISIVWSGERLEFEGAKINYGEHPIRLWILIRLYGIRSIREAVRRKILLGNAFSDRLTHHPEFFDVQYANEHGVTIFQYNNKNVKDRKEDVNKMTSIFYNFVTLSSAIKCSLFTFHGKVLIKAVINYERCQQSIMEESISTLINCVEEFEEAMKKKKGIHDTPINEYCDMIGGSQNETTDKTQSEEKSDNKI